jgi:hypothetical protein
MTIKEKDKLAILVGKVLDFTSILHPPAADSLYKEIVETEDKDVLDVLIRHMDVIGIYERYNRFDHEASTRDIEALLHIIFSN